MRMSFVANRFIRGRVFYKSVLQVHMYSRKNGGKVEIFF